MARTDPSSKTGRLAIMASVCIVVAALYFAQDVLIPLALSVLLGFLLTPVVIRLERLRFGRIFSVVLVTLIVFALMLSVGAMVYSQVGDLLDNLPSYRSNIENKVQGFAGLGSGRFDKAAEVVESIQEKLARPSTTQAVETTPAERALDMDRPPDVPAPNPLVDAPDRAADVPLPGASPDKPVWTASVDVEQSRLGAIGEYLGVVAGPLGTAGLVIVFTFFMLLQREDLRDRLIRLIGQGRINITTQALDDAAGRISRYLLAQALVNGVYGIAIAIGLYLIGLIFGDRTFPNFLLWGLLCALLRFIPYVGPWIAASFPLLVAFAVYEGYSVFIASVALFILIELLSNNAMEPWLYGASTGMSTVAVLVSAVFWTWLWGPIGLILATPLTVCLVVVGKYVPQLSFLSILLGDEPVLEPAERVFQRLLALDQEEAMEVVEEYLEDMTLEEVYENVLLRALAMAEQERHRGNLDDERQKFIRESMRDLVEESADLARRGEAPARLPQDCTIHIVNLPAHDEADEIVGLMLATLLQIRGYCVFNLSTTALAGEMLDAVQKHRADVVCVSALPPSAVSHARYLCKRLYTRLPDLRMVVGLWTVNTDLKKAKNRITSAAGARIATRLPDAVAQIQQLVQPLLLSGEKPPPESREPQPDAP